MAKAATKTTKTSNAVPGPVPEDQKAPVEATKKPTPIATKQAPAAKPTSVFEAGYKLNHYAHFCEKEVTKEDIIRPEYWCHVATKYPVLSKITIVNRLMGWEADVRVLEIGKGFARVVPLSYTEWQGISRDTDEIAALKRGFTVEPRSDGWRIVNAQGEVEAAGMQSEAEAKAMLDTILSKMIGKAA